MIKYICIPVNNQSNNKINQKKLRETFKDLKRENFQDLKKEINVANKCPSFYFKNDDVCCPVPLVDNKCPVDKKSEDVTRINGMPICTLNVEASVNWKNNYGKILHLCTDLPPMSKSYERIVDEENLCDKNMKLINNKCYPPCPPGFQEIGLSCIQLAFEREALSEPPTCSNDSENINGKCLKNCNLGYTKYKNYCIPSQLSGF